MVEIFNVGGIATSGGVKAAIAEVPGNTPSTSPTTGALTVAGGAGIAGALNVGGDSSFIRANGDMIEFYQGGVMKTQMKLAAISGLLGLLVTSGFVACDSFFGKGKTTETATGTSGTSATLRGVVYANGLFVVVGQNGTILTSSSGTAWTSRTSGTSVALFGITYANGLFVAVGDGGAVFTSPDGVTWASRTTGVVSTLYSITYGNGLFVAVGYNGAIFTSPDGVTWTSRTTGTDNALIGATYANGLFVVVGRNGTILTSSSGTAWTSRTSGISGYLRGVVYANGLFVAVGNETILTSPDGVAWTYRTGGTDIILYNVTYANGLFMIVGDSGAVIRIAYTSDNWQIAGGFTEKAVSSSKTSYKLFDGKWLQLNSDGSVKWGSTA
jgi:hypothetical protein